MECRVWSVKCGVQSVECETCGSVECEGVKDKVWSGE